MKILTFRTIPVCVYVPGTGTVMGTGTSTVPVRGTLLQKNYQYSVVRTQESGT
jgi:hypothetical protein